MVFVCIGDNELPPAVPHDIKLPSVIHSAWPLTAFASRFCLLVLYFLSTWWCWALLQSLSGIAGDVCISTDGKVEVLIEGADMLSISVRHDIKLDVREDGKFLRIGGFCMWCEAVACCVLFACFVYSFDVVMLGVTSIAFRYCRRCQYFHRRQSWSVDRVGWYVAYFCLPWH